MLQELADLRDSILENRYDDALALVHQLDDMSRSAKILIITAFLARLLVHIIKNQAEQRLTGSWAVSICDSTRQIKKYNLQENKTSYYLKPHDWQSMIDEELEAAVDQASLEVCNGTYNSFQLWEILDRDQVVRIAHDLLTLTYQYSAKELTAIAKEYLTGLPGGAEWKQGNRI